MEGKKTEEEPRGARRALPLFVGLPLIVLVAVAAVVFSGGGGGPKPAAEQAERPSGGEAAGAGSAGLGHPALGRKDAPVVMIEYGDYG